MKVMLFNTEVMLYAETGQNVHQKTYFFREWALIRMILAVTNPESKQSTR